MIIVGSMIGSGIFLAPALIAGITVESHLGAGSFVLVWIVGGLLTLCAALSFGELSPKRALTCLPSYSSTLALLLSKTVSPSGLASPKQYTRFMFYRWGQIRASKEASEKAGAPT